MSKIKVTARQQVRLPKDILKHLGVQPGDTIAIDKLPHGRIELRSACATAMISEVFGILKRPRSRPLSIAEIQVRATRGWAGRR